MSRTQSARVRAFAKVNLDLRVLHRRPDGFHELRSIFQTISLADKIDIAFTPARRTQITVEGNVQISDNLIARAAQQCLDILRLTGRLEFRLRKKIPMGAGLGGGSSDAAAVLLALPVLARRSIPLEQLMRMAADLGSDVPFFLLGGTAVGVGRGTELYPLPDTGARAGVLVAPPVHVSYADAYLRLSPRLTMESQQNKMVSFQSVAWALGRALTESGNLAGSNDFETVVFEQHPQLKALKQRLLRLGASPAMMTGSGSAIFGLFASGAQAARAIEQMKKEERVFPIRFVSRARYRATWHQRLREHVKQSLWPPQSRYAR